MHKATFAALVLVLVGLNTSARAEPGTDIRQQTPLFETGVSKSGYLLKSGDILRVSVVDYEEFSGDQIVLPDGTISLPLVGSIPAQQRTTEELMREVTARLQPYLKNPVVNLSVVTLGPTRVNVAGEVYRPGPVQLRSYTDASSPPLTSAGPAVPNFAYSALPPRIPTLSAALMEVGGVTKDADLRRVLLRRRSPEGELRDQTIDLWAALTSPDAPPDPPLQDGDVVYVPRLAPDASLDRRLIARSSVSSRNVRVRVVGEVKKPGDVDVLADGSLGGAVAAAGGPTDKADLGRVLLVRLGEDGKPQKRTIDLASLADSNQVQQGDILWVPKSGTSFAFDLLGAVFSPFVGVFNLIRLLE